MVEEQLTQSPVNELLAEFGTRLNEVEEKQRLLRDRALLIGENLILIKEEFEKQNFELKQHLRTQKEELKEIKKILNRIVVELPNFARKSELEILENQSKMFQPLELARISDVERIINKKINKTKK